VEGKVRGWVPAVPVSWLCKELTCQDKGRGKTVASNTEASDPGLTTGEEGESPLKERIHRVGSVDDGTLGILEAPLLEETDGVTCTRFYRRVPQGKTRPASMNTL